MEHQFKIKQGSFEILKKKNRKYWAGVILVFILIGLTTYTILSYFNIPKEPGFKKLTIILSLAVIFIFFVNIWQIKFIKNLFSSYRLIISNDSIILQQEKKSTISVNLTDIEQITKEKNGYFTIRGKDKNQIIYISKYIENYKLLETLLNNIKPINKN